ncbi:MAG: hypothetical protein AAFN93_03010 [Bacteroidota bacterium]
MDFEIDVLILHAEADNEILDGHELGWTSTFKKFLEIMLTQVLDEKPNILLKSEHDGLTAANPDKVALVIPILSPAFMASEKCLENLQSFLEVIKKDDSRRILKIHKRPMARKEEPAELRNSFGYELYDHNLDTDEIDDYVDFFSISAERQYWMKLVNISYDIHECLSSLKGESANSYNGNNSRKSVYLAETGKDLTVQRMIIKRELQRHGYLVRPEHLLPEDEKEFTRVVQKEIEESSVSIHLISASYGRIPEGGTKSVLDIQNEIAAEKSSRVRDKSEFSRLIWISTQVEGASERQIAFIEAIKRDMTSSESAEILQTPLEDFKNIIREELIEVGLGKKLTITGLDQNTTKPAVYLIHNPIDEKEVAPIKKFIQKSGYEVLIPAFEGELLELRQRHVFNLRHFDIAIIYQGQVNNEWVRMKLLDLFKAPGFGRKKAIKGKAIITQVEEKIDLSVYENYNVKMIEANQKGSLDDLKEFLEETNE